MTHPNHTWLPVLAQLTESSTACVLVTVMQARGSTPREAGTKMVVTKEEQFGTIGGGNLEFEAIREARELLAKAVSSPAQRDYALGPTLAQCCGGSVSVLLEPFVHAPRRVFIFGAGHVGRELVRVMENLPVKLVWVDERAQEFPATLPANCEKRVLPSPTDAVNNVQATDAVIILTHSHELDYALVKAAFDHGVPSYLGLIGSETKSVRFRKKLAEEGISKELLARLICPIGIASITGKHPREIAIAVAAELLALGITHLQHAR